MRPVFCGIGQLIGHGRSYFMLNFIASGGRLCSIRDLKVISMLDFQQLCPQDALRATDPSNKGGIFCCCTRCLWQFELFASDLCIIVGNFAEAYCAG